MCGENYQWFSRKGTDYTENLGFDKDTNFSQRLHPFFRDDVENCVLDGELVVYDKEVKRLSKLAL